MQLLQSYTDFLNRVDELGFTSFSQVMPGLPSLSGETREDLWHTSDPQTDPWSCKDRAAEEKRLAIAIKAIVTNVVPWQSVGG